ncbi:MAG: FliO/MopB family protein [Chlamydiia bacterium]|nr:FliO/MopB family protein [Chlamydiia bacterium]
MKSFLLLLFFNSLFAEEIPFLEEDPLLAKSQSEGYSYWGEFANMMITLLVLLVMIFFTVYFLKKFMRSRVRHNNPDKGIRILQQRSLNAKATLYLIDVCGKGIVISESQTGINLITELSPGTDLVKLLEEHDTSRPSFREVLQNRLKNNFLRQKNTDSPT